MTRRPIGPHSLQTFTSESRTEQGPNAWGAYENWPPFASSTMSSGWLPEMAGEREKASVDPSFADGLVYGPSRGHAQPRYANLIGMPRGYGYGATMCCWVVDYLANWAGDWGFVRHHRTQYRNPALTGNVTYLTGEVTNKWIDEEFARAVVELTYEMATHAGTQMARGVAEIELPQSEDDDSTVNQDARVRERLRVITP